MARADDLERLYAGLSAFARGSRELSTELHPGLSLVAYTMLSFVDENPGSRAADVAAAWGLDKSTVSRQLNPLIEAGLLARAGERPGRRGLVLELSPAGRSALDDAAAAIRTSMVERLEDWDDRSVAEFASAVQRFNGG